MRRCDWDWTEMGSVSRARPDWDEYFLDIAAAVARRADCTRRRVGAVIVRDHRVVSCGYNGAPAGRPGCLSDGACPRGRHYPVLKYVSDGVSATFCAELDKPSGERIKGQMHGTGCMCKAYIKVCACGSGWPCPSSVDPGSSYDGTGACIAVHAEANAIIYADHQKCQGATIYCTDEPCSGCLRMIDGAGIVRVVVSPASARADDIGLFGLPIASRHG